MKSLKDSVPEETALRLGSRAKALRLAAGWKRATLAARAGVTESSLKRFEQTGGASLELALRVAFALGRLAEFDGALQLPDVRSIDELERRSSRPQPKRGTR
jgi:transcriptional regulator with XRE-family HTH domain